MEKKQNKISINKFEKHCKFTAPNIVEKTFNLSGDEKVEYQIKPRISLEECMRFVSEVVNECVRPTDDMVIPVVRQFLIDRGVLTYYGNFRMPEDISKTFDLVMGAQDIVSEILDHIDSKQFNMIVDAIEEGISFEKQKMVSAQEIKTNQIITEVNQLVTSMSGLFEGVDGEMVSGFISSVSQMPNVTAKDLASAIVTETKSK